LRDLGFEYFGFDWWEEYGRALFIADANGDGKLTLEELAAKGKDMLTKALQFLDANQDGQISLEDFNLNLTLGPIQNLILELFDEITLGQGELELFKMKMWGQDAGFGLEDFDKNSDKKITAADLFMDAREKAVFLLPMLSQKLDKNQDGKIQREELTQFIEEMFDQLDMDKNGAISLEDVYSLLLDNGLDCLQVGALRSYIKVFIETVNSEIRDFLSYIFHQFDMDGNGKISPTELEKMQVPCDTSDRWMHEVIGPNDKKSCGSPDLFGDKINGFIGSFPDSIFSEPHGRGGGRNGPRRETFAEKMTKKMTNRACEMLTG
jgi:Ca2+-binding EF-hand superfamily protein